MVIILFLMCGLYIEKSFIILGCLLLWSKFFFNKHSLILNLLLLESHMMVNFVAILWFSSFLSGSLFMVYITISVCEAILGLCILVYTSRHKSVEMMNVD